MSELSQPGILAPAPKVVRYREFVHLPALDALDGGPDQRALGT